MSFPMKVWGAHGDGWHALYHHELALQRVCMKLQASINIKRGRFRRRSVAVPEAVCYGSGGILSHNFAPVPVPADVSC